VKLFDLPLRFVTLHYAAAGHRLVAVGDGRAAWMPVGDDGIPDPKSMHTFNSRDFESDQGDSRFFESHAVANDGRHLAVGLLNGSVWVLRLDSR
jgi:hypothetical protein